MGKEILKICAIAFLCVSIGAVIKHVKGELLFAIRAAGSVLIFGMLTLSLEPLLGEFISMGEATGASEYLTVMLKGVGVALLTQISAGVCRDCGDSSVASAVEFAGKTEILLLCLPFIRRILEYASELASFEV